MASLLLPTILNMPVIHCVQKKSPVLLGWVNTTAHSVPDRDASYLNVNNWMNITDIPSKLRKISALCCDLHVTPLSFAILLCCESAMRVFEKLYTAGCRASYTPQTVGRTPFPLPKSTQGSKRYTAEWELTPERCTTYTFWVLSLFYTNVGVL